MREKLRKHGVSILLVLVAVMLLVQVKMMEELQELQGQVQMQNMGPDSVRNMISAEFSGMQYRLEDSLKQEASSLSSFHWELGEVNTDALRASIKVSITPKEVAGDTSVRVQAGTGETVTLAREGVTFTGTVWADLFEEVGLKVLIDRGSVTTVEEPVVYYGSPWEYYRVDIGGVPRYSVEKTQNGKTVSVRGNASLDLRKPVEGGNAVQSAILRATLDGEELWNKPLTSRESRIPGVEIPGLQVDFQGVRVAPGQTLELFLLVTDRCGLVYHYRMSEDFLNDSKAWGDTWSDFMLTGVYKQDGTLLYMP
jgi:hypothetical protein